MKKLSALARAARNPSLLVKFELLSLIPVLLLSVVLATTLKGTIRERTLADARQDATLIADLSFRQMLSRGDVEDGLGPAAKRNLDSVVAGSLKDDEITRVVIYNRDLRVAYSDLDRLVGRKLDASPELKTSLSGKSASAVVPAADGRSERLEQETLGTYVPLRFPGTKTPAGGLALYQPFEPIAAGIADDTRALYLILLAGLAVLWAAIARIASGASKQLRRQATDNERQAQHDALTGLPNRALFRDLVTSAMAARPKSSVVAVMVMDLDRFKEINDTLGHYNGDLLLQRVGPRIRRALREADTVARLGGDEYAVLLPEIPNAKAVSHAAQRILKELREPIVAGGLALEIEASIGIAIFPDHGDRVDTLLQRADVAMYTAKEAHSGFEIYSAEQHAYSPDRLALVGELRRAIDEKELLLHYQPKASLETGRIIGVEGLVRWQHPRRGMLRPDEFVGLAEHTSLISPLTLFVLEEAIVQCRRWQKEGHKLTVAVNLSVRNLMDRQLPKDVARLLEKHSLSPDRLELEITESMVMSEPRRALAVLCELSDMGIALSIDDFGTGYSSLAYLKKLPVQAIKIDKSFVMDMIEDEDNGMIVQSTVDLGQNLGLKVVAEGVESEEAWRRLAAMGCDTAQGFFLAKPLPVEELMSFILGRAPATDEPARTYAAPQTVAAPQPLRAV